MSNIYKIISITIFLLASKSFAHDDNIISPKESLKIGFESKFIPLIPQILDIKNMENLNYNQTYKLINQAVNKIAQADYKWACTKPIVSSLNPGVLQYTFTCDGQWPKIIPTQLIAKDPIKHLKINMIFVNTSNNKNTIKAFITAKPIDGKICTQSDNPNCIKPLITYAQSYNKNHQDKLIAAINGGFFMMKPSQRSKIIFNCLWQMKIIKDINFDKSIDTFTFGNSLLISNGTKYSEHCQLFGENSKVKIPRATFFISKNGKLSIRNAPSGHHDYPEYIQALGGSPLLIQNGEYAIDWQGLGPFFEFAADSSLAITDTGNLLLLTINGEDLKTGAYSFEVANLFMTVIPDIIHDKIKSAMSQDRGGSTSLVTCEGENRSFCKIISNSGKPTPGRPIYSGLGIFTNH